MSIVRTFILILLPPLGVACQPPEQSGVADTSPFCELPVPRVVTLAQQIVDAGTSGFSREDATELAQAVLDAWITENEADDASS